MFSRPRADFPNDEAFNDHLELVQDLVYDLVNGSHEEAKRAKERVEAMRAEDRQRGRERDGSRLLEGSSTTTLLAGAMRGGAQPGAALFLAQPMGPVALALPAPKADQAASSASSAAASASTSTSAAVGGSARVRLLCQAGGFVDVRASLGRWALLQGLAVGRLS